jgi:Ca2+:H+ antiporter
MEIGSAYALQVCLLQIPAMVVFSAWYAPDKMGSVSDTFTYVLPYQGFESDSEIFLA